MSIYNSLVFCNIQGYPLKLVLPFFRPRSMVFLLTSLFSECCSQRHFVAFCANMLCFQQHSRFAQGRTFPTAWLDFY